MSELGHSNPKPLRCSQCGEGIRNVRDFREHLRHCSPKDPHICFDCGKNCGTVIAQNEHNLTCGSKQKPARKEPEAMYMCHHCKAVFNTAARVKMHMMSCGIVKYNCKVCGKGCPSIASLQCHMLQHSGQRPYMCSYCDKSFRSPDLKRHMRVHTGERPFLCPRCEWRFPQSADLKRHMKIHGKDKLHTCMHCQQDFKELEALQLHLETHKQLEAHVCLFCDQTFNNLDKVNEHLLISHRAKTVYACAFCNMVFRKWSELKIHVKLHPDRQGCPYKCLTCTRVFKILSQLESHVLQCDEKNIDYSVDSLLHCSFCDQVFNDLDKLKEHSQRRHTGEKVYACAHCKITFSHLGELQEHVSTHTNQQGKPYKCVSCTRVFKMLPRLEEHVLQCEDKKNHRCVDCQMRFHSSEKLIIHMAVCSGHKLYSCAKCNMQFNDDSNLAKHQATHVGEQPCYVCYVCHKSCSSLQKLSDHISKKHKSVMVNMCTHCGIHFLNPLQLQYHMSTVHVDLLKCTECNVTFSTSYLLKKHMPICRRRQLAQTCVHCGQKFETVLELCAHTSIHEQEIWQRCNQCGAWYKIEGDVTLDSNKPFICVACCEAFSELFSIDVHNAVFGTKWKEI